jgi:glycosyltransferase involved in cell wall biosynthesis
MKLSILIPTHNRPKLFPRCLRSVLEQITDDVEVIVNNDSNDIEEISHPQVTYHYNQYSNLSSVYKFLLSQATGEYVYFLEDDDYLRPDFLSNKFDADIIVGNYMPTFNPDYTLQAMTYYKDGKYASEAFASLIDFKLLQLSQFVYKRSAIVNFPFPLDNNINNDIKLTLFGAQRSKVIRTLNKIFFYQTIDGGDNISFPESNPSIEITCSPEYFK